MNKAEKEKYKAMNETVYQIEFENLIFIFRPLGRLEYAEIALEELDEGEMQEAICQESVLYPKDYDFTKGLAGIPEVLSENILDASGLKQGQIFDILMDYREEMDNFDFQIDSIIHEVYPEYAIEEIESWPVRKTLYYYSRAEWVMRNVRHVEAETFYLLDKLIELRIESLNKSEEVEEIEEEPPSKEDEKNAIKNEFLQAEQQQNERLAAEQAQPKRTGGFSSSKRVEKTPESERKKPIQKINKPETNSEEAKEMERRMLQLMNQEASGRNMKVGEVQKHIPSRLEEEKMFKYQEDLHGSWE